jgi:Tol biopolymer transport system component/C-terminal processing protease CtpA/Prc
MRSAVLALFVPLCAWAAEPRAYFSEPSLSPDGTEIVFVSGGDIWTVPARGGVARLLVSHPATESRPLYSPDGKRLAFVSTRTGNGDIYVLTLASGALARITYDDAPEQLDGWSADGAWLYFSSSARDIASMQDIYRVNAAGGTPMPVSADRYASEYFSAPSPDGRTVAFTARGVAGTQWWRKGHSHLDESEIWLLRDGTRYERFSDGGAKEAWPMWARGGAGLYYVSDRSGAQNIWYRTVAGRARQITQFRDGRVVWPSIAAEARAMVFERDFGVWRLDLESGKAAPVPITRRGAPAGPGVLHVSATGQFQEMALSPDGKKVAVITHGEIFAASAKDGGDAARITFTDAPESQVAWSPDSFKLVYVTDRHGEPRIYQYEFKTGKETALTTAGSCAAPGFSPDGKLVAFTRDGQQLVALDLATRQERVLASGSFGRAPILRERSYAWSPDSKWIAYVNVSGKAFHNVFLTTAAGGESRQITFLANAGANGVSWSPDGRYLLFATGQRTEPGQLARVDLTPRTPKFREDQFRDLFKDETPAKPAAETLKVAPVILDGIRRRLSLLSLGLDVDSAAISPDGKWLVFMADSGGQRNLYSWSLDELAKEPPVARQLTSTAGSKSHVSFTPDSKEIFYLDRGGIQSMSLENRLGKPLGVTAEMDVDFTREKMEVFRQGWRYLRDHFFDPGFNGVDWNAVRAEYEPLIAGAATQDEMRRLMNLMVGELNASHLGVGSGSTPTAVTGRIGVRFDRAEYEASGRLKVAEVLAQSPAELAGIKAGDVIEAVDGASVAPPANFDALVEHKIGKRVTVRLTGREVVARPVNLVTEKNLAYREWVEQKRAYVAAKSGGRLGYVHMYDMSSNSLDRLYIDLDTENHARQGVVIDIRNNSGGFINAYALDVLARRPYLRMTERGGVEAPARTVLGQRALEAPTVLVVNQHSLSDAEDFTEGYRALKLGKVVGEPTAGWIIYTWNTTLLDGTSLRLPRTRVRGAAGDEMEMHPRRPDILVVRPIGERDRDSQLDAAIAALR